MSAAIYRAAAQECEQTELLGIYSALDRAGGRAFEAFVMQKVFGNWPVMATVRDNALNATMLLFAAEVVEEIEGAVNAKISVKTTQTPAGRAREISSTNRD